MRWLVVLVLLLVPVGAALAQTGEEAPQGDVARGESIYQANCAMCHGTDATGMMGMHPALTGVVDRLTVEGVEIAIRNGRDTRPPMPAFDTRLDDTDIADLIAHLDGLPDGPRNFAHDDGDGDGMTGDGPMMDRDGMGDMMDQMTGGGNVALWIVVVILAAALAGVIGYLIASRNRSDGSPPSRTRQTAPQTLRRKSVIAVLRAMGPFHRGQPRSGAHDADRLARPAGHIPQPPRSCIIVSYR
jgi:mono/diheme cytochrome c family protein